ncbi:MAG TPA: hypothetical protein VM325_04135 [Alphaproteobacteria bacterium]|nr:hypothetical protein [Alphaproteobacteria bacterium]
MLRVFPLLVLVVAAYNAVVFLTQLSPTSALFAIGLPSKDALAFSLGGLLVVLGLLLLYVEIVKATRTSTVAVVDHVLSMAVFVAALLELLLLKGFGTLTFFLIVLMTFIDVIAGFTVTIQGARRDFGVDRGGY